MDEGRLREGSVAIRGTTYIPLNVPQLIEECFRQILILASSIENPFEQSFFLLVHLPYLQPFMDGNKRTARLAANLPFIRMNCTPIAFIDVAPEAFTDGMITVYELNRVELLRDVFVYAYERSCERYGAIRTSLGEPDPFRLAYRLELKAIVREVVLAKERDSQASARIRAYAEAHLPKEARDRFRAVAETELSGLHEGNFARYQVRPSEFAAWRNS
jgi:Fic family protein